MPPRDRFDAWFDGEDLPPATSGPSPRNLPRPGSGLTRILGIVTACLLLVGLVGGAHRAGFIRVPGEPGVAVESPSPTPTDGSVSPTPTPSPTPIPTAPPTPPIAGRLPSEACKIANGEDLDFPSGFPITDSASVATTGTIRVALVFVDFSNAPKQGSSDSYFDRITTKVTADYKEMSYGKLNLEFVKVPGWVRMDKASAAYNVSQAGRGDYSDTVAFAQEVLRKTDPQTDYTGVSSIAIFAAEEATGIAGDYAQPLVDSLPTKEPSSIDSVIVTGGGWWIDDWDAMTVTHEFGHVLGLADLYDPDPNTYSPYVGDFDLMSISSTSSLAPSMLGWNRWRLGWITDDSVVCVKPTAENRITLSPLQSGTGSLLAVVPLSATRALIMESRRPLGMDQKLPTSGVLVYIVDTRLESTKGPIKAVGVFTNETMSDVLLGVGEYLEASGWVVSVTRNEVWGNEFAIFP